MSVDGGGEMRSVAELALDRGERHRASGRLEDAEAAYFEAACEAADSDSTSDGTTTTRPVVLRARIGLGRIELRRGSPERAFGWFLSARDVAPDDWEPLYWQGCAQGRLADYPGAQESLTAALRLRSGKPSIVIQRSYARFMMGDLAAALDDLLAAQRRGALDETALLTLASIRLARKEWPEAEKILRTLLDRDPKDVKASELMGAMREWQERTEEALEWYRRAAESSDVSPLTCNRLGILHARAGHPEVALTWLQRARLDKGPDDEVLYYSGWVSFQLGEFEDCIDVWTKLKRRHSGPELDKLIDTATHELARKRLANRDYDAALPLLEDCLRGKIGGTWTSRALAEVRLRLAAPALARRNLDTHGEARQHLRAAAALVLEDYRFPFLLALIEWARGAPLTALPLATRACNLGGLSRAARLAVVRCALEAGDGAIAERELLRMARRPSQQARHLARCLRAQRWSDAADVLRTADEPDLPAELLAHCLVLAGRDDELDLSSRRGARAGLLHGLAAAAQGEPTKARSLLAAVARARPGLAAASTAIGHVDHLLAVRAVEAGSWQDAAGLIAGSSWDARLAPAPLLDGLILVVAGRGGQASGYLEEALRRDPTNHRVLHAVSVAWLNGGETIAVRAGIAALVALVSDEAFWEQFQSDAASRYQTTITTAALTQCRRAVERRAAARAGPSHGVLLLRETAAASALRELGGFPSVPAGILVCGPLMISLLGLEQAWGEFVARHSGPGDSRADQWRALRQLFSSLGATTALLEAERPEEALAALDKIACEECRAPTAPAGHPRVCVATCPDFNTHHPGYAGLPDKGRRLAEDAAWLVIAARLGVARRLVATDPDDAGAVIRLWEGAITAASLVGARERTQREVADTVLGRAKALAKTDRLAAAITLLEAAEQVLADASAREELRSELGQLLTDRGVDAANDDRLEYALSDLRRAVRYSPYSPRPIISLSLALQRRAGEQDDRQGRYESLREAKRMLESAASELSGSPEFGQQLDSVRKELTTVSNGWAIELAAETRYEEALEVLNRALVDLPGDDLLRKSQHNIRMAMRNRRRTGS